jgi:putative ABC transport system permease protein
MGVLTMDRRFLLAALTLFLGAPAFAGNWHVPTSSRGLKNPVPINERTAKAAEVIYRRECLACHGQLGAGDGEKLKVEYDLRTILAPLTDGELYWKITHGVGKMPSFAGVLNDRDRWLMVNHLRELGKTLPAPGATEATAAAK